MMSSPSYTSLVKNFESITNLPHLSSKAAVGFAAMMSSRDLPCDFSAATLSRTVTSISRNSINWARLPTGPWPGIRIVFSVVRSMAMLAQVMAKLTLPPSSLSMNG